MLGLNVHMDLEGFYERFTADWNLNNKSLQIPGRHLLACKYSSQGSNML